MATITFDLDELKSFLDDIKLANLTSAGIDETGTMRVTHLENDGFAKTCEFTIAGVVKQDGISDDVAGNDPVLLRTQVF